MNSTACTDRWGVSTQDWELYQQNPTPELREQMLTKYVPLVRSAAAKVKGRFPNTTELDDLISTGAIGMVEAFDKFEPNRGFQFETYARPRIKGAILDEWRVRSRVSRTTKKKSQEIKIATALLSNKFGRRPERMELAAHLGYIPEELDRVLRVNDNTVFTSIVKEMSIDGEG